MFHTPGPGWTVPSAPTTPDDDGTTAPGFPRTGGGWSPPTLICSACIPGRGEGLGLTLPLVRGVGGHLALH